MKPNDWRGNFELSLLVYRRRNPHMRTTKHDSPEMKLHEEDYPKNYHHEDISEMLKNELGYYKEELFFGLS